MSLVLGDDDLDVDSGSDVHVGDIPDLCRGSGEVNDSLVDSHLESIEGVRTLAARTLPDSEPKDLGGQSDGPLSLDLTHGALGLKASAYLLEIGNIGAGHGDADLVHILLLCGGSL